LVYSLVATCLLGISVSLYKVHGSNFEPNPNESATIDIKKEIYCGAPKVIVGNIINKFGELPIFATPGDDEVSITLFMNGKTKGWTLVEFLHVEDDEKSTSYDYACVIETGTGGKIDLKNLMDKTV
jgi:hypothetical protein